jgi:hypothetical protein
MTEEATRNPKPWTVLSKVPYADHIEKKGKLSYISWASGWTIVKEHFPDATFQKHLFTQPDGSELPYMKDQQGNTYVQVTVWLFGAMEDESWDGNEVTEVFPVTDFQNKAIKNPSSQDVSNAFQRALAKCFAYFGLGIHLYTNEDIPSESNDSAPSERKIKSTVSELSPLEQHTKFCNDAIEYIGEINNLPDLNHYYHSEIKDRLPLIEEEAKEQSNLLKIAVSKQKASLTSDDIPFE